MQTSTSGRIPRSHSQYTSYAQCGEMYRLERVARVASDPAGWFVQGTAVHAAIEAYERSGRTLTTAEAIAHFERSWRQELAAGREVCADLTQWRTGGRKTATKDLDDRKALGAHQVADYIAYTEDAGAAEQVWTTPDGRLAVELPFTIQLGDVPVRGVIDQVVSTPYGLTVRDIKTGTKAPASSLQLALYRRALRETFGVDVIWGDFWICARLGRSPKRGGPTDPIDLTTIDQDWLSGQYAAMDAAQRHGVYLASPGDHCRACGVQRHCKAKGQP
ncbi:RecB family exonuclease [Streptomyces chrestomyceticus]|uniref:PD-(D/E)XK nuclease family protein n=1 Tax=Streptomyces chrestomyceticus TaxID=68185 RepID=A0ABU7WLM9_9ACTN